MKTRFHLATVIGALALLAATATGVPITGGDSTPPTVVSIVRQSPSGATTPPVGGPGGSVTFRVTFSEAVQFVDASDFVVTGPAASGTTLSVSVVSSTVYDVTVNSVTVEGALELAVAP